MTEAYQYSTITLEIDGEDIINLDNTHWLKWCNELKDELEDGFIMDDGDTPDIELSKSSIYDAGGDVRVDKIWMIISAITSIDSRDEILNHCALFFQTQLNQLEWETTQLEAAELTD